MKTRKNQRFFVSRKSKISVKRILFILMIVLFAVQFVSAGVTNPQPTELELAKGESGRFKFQIQTIANPASVLCTYSLKGESPLIVEFDDEEVLVEANSKKYVYGTVTVPEDIIEQVSFDTRGFTVFEENFCVSCRNVEGIAGASVQINTCDLPIRVKVVNARTKENMYIPPKPALAPKPPIPNIIVISAIVVIILLAIIIRRKKKNMHLK